MIQRRDKNIQWVDLKCFPIRKHKECDYRLIENLSSYPAKPQKVSCLITRNYKEKKSVAKFSSEVFTILSVNGVWCLKPVLILNCKKHSPPFKSLCAARN